MENVTFVSNSHQRPAADNLQKLKSLLTNTRQSKLKVRLSRLPSKIFM